MPAVWSPEELASRFAPYIEELHEFFSLHRMPFGTAADLNGLAERAEVAGAFRAELSSLVRSMILREGGAMPQTELLEVLAIAASGTTINPSAPDLQQPMRKLLSFVGSVANRPWNEPPPEAHAGGHMNSASQGASTSATSASHRPDHAAAPAHPKVEDTRREAAEKHSQPAHHSHPNNVVPFPVRGERQRWGQERFDPDHRQRAITGPDDLPDDIDPNPAEAFASALGARVHAGISAKSKPAPGSSHPKQSQAVPQSIVSKTPEDVAHQLPPVAASQYAPDPDAADSAMVDGAVEHHFGLLQKHSAPAEDTRFLPHAPHHPVDAALEQEEAESDPFFAEQPPPSWRTAAIAWGAALSLLIAVFVSVHSHRASDVALQPDPVRTVPAAPAEARTPSPAPQVASAPADTKQRKQAKPSPYADSDDSDSPAPRHSHGSEDLIAEPYSSQPLLRTANTTTTPQTTAQPRATMTAASASGNMIASNSAPEGPGNAGQVSGTTAAPPIAAGFAAHPAGAPLYHTSAERTYRNPDAALAGELPERAPGTALEDHPRYLDVSSGVMAGNILSAPMPDYPMIAKIAHIHGKVILQAVIDRDGSVSAAKVLSGNRLLRGAAVDAVRQWRYKPYVLQGKPVDVSTIVTVEFRGQTGS